MANKIARTAIAVFVIAMFTNFISDKATALLVFASFLLMLGAALFKSIERNENL